MAKKNIIQRFANGFKSGFNSVNKSIDHSNYRNAKDLMISMQGGDFCCTEFFEFNDYKSSIIAYADCPPVSSIINKQILAINNGKTWVLSTTTGKELTTDVGAKITKLLKKPNPLQSWKQFQANYNTHIRLFGFCVIIPLKIKGAPMHTTEAMWIVPPNVVDFVYAENKKKYFTTVENQLKGISIGTGNDKVNYALEDIIILKDTTVSFDNVLLPESPIKSIKQCVNNLIGIYESQGTLIHARGSLGILSPKMDPNGAIATTEDEKEELQAQYNQRYGLKGSQWKIILSNTEMNWQSMMMPYKDLQLPEWATEQIQTIADSLNYPYKLLANTNGGSIGGTETESFKKQLYQDFVVPFTEMIFEQWTNYFNGEKYGLKLDVDFSHIAVLQEDARKKAIERKTKNEYNKQEWDAGIRTLDQWLVDLGEDPLPDGRGNLYITDLKNSSVPLAMQLGVGGTQSFIEVLNSELPKEQKRNALVLLFGLSENDASLLTA